MPIPLIRYILPICFTLFSCLELLSAPVRVASFNLQNGIASGDDYEATKAILTRIDADLIAFQELRTATISNWHNLAQELGYDHYFHNTENSQRAGSLWLGYFSRFPIVASSTVNSTSPAHEMSRLPLKALVRVPGAANPLVLWNVHHKSAGLESDHFRRAIEAYRVRQNIDAHLSNNPSHREFVVLGDFNDDFRSTTQTVSFSSMPSIPISNYVLGSDIEFPVLYNTFPNSGYSNAGGGMQRLPAFQQGSNSPVTFPGWNSVLDYIFVSDSLQNSALGAPKAEIYNSARDVSTGGVGLPKVLPLPPSNASATSSDHLALFADLNMVDAPAPEFAVSDSLDFSPIGTWGTNFQNLSKTYTLRNNRNSALQWFVSTPAAWMNALPSSGSLAPGDEIEVTVSLNPRALLLPLGEHFNEILFSDFDTGSLVFREAALRVIEADILLQSPTFATATINSTFDFQGLMGSVVSNGIIWTNRSNGQTGALPYSPNWTAQIPLAYGSNHIEFRAPIHENSVLASDNPGDAVYSSNWVNGSNGGEGFGPWELVLINNGWAGHALFGTDVFNVPASFGGAFSLWASGDGVSTARRDFSRPLASTDTFTLQFDNNWIDRGKSVGCALADDSGVKRLEFFFVGSELYYRVRDAGGDRVTNLFYTDQGLEISIQLNDQDGYILTAGNTTVTGNLAPGGEITTLIATNNGSGGATEFDLYLGKIQISDSSGIWASDSPTDSAYADGWTNGSQGGTGLGPWVLEKFSPGGRAGHIRFSNSVFNVPASFNGALSLWASGNGTSIATRPYLEPLVEGDSFTLQFDTNLVQPGKTVGFALTDQNGAKRFEFGYTGGDPNYFVNDVVTGRDTPIAYTQEGLVLRIELNAENAYTLFVNGNQTLSGTLAPGDPIRHLMVENNGSGPGTAYDIYLGAMLVERKVLLRDTSVAAPVIVRQVDPANATDGLPNEWWMEFFGTLDSVSALADDDGDGWNNAQEFALGTHPKDKSSTLRLQPPVFANGKYHLEWDAVAGKTYRILGSRTLTDANWQPVATPITADSNRKVTFQHDPGEESRFFYRLQLVP